MGPVCSGWLSDGLSPSPRLGSLRSFQEGPLPASAPFPRENSRAPLRMEAAARARCLTKRPPADPDMLPHRSQQFDLVQKLTAAFSQLPLVVAGHC